MRRSMILCSLVLAGVAACGGSDSTSPTVSIVGTWNLKTINGTNLPYSFPPSQNGTVATVTADQLVLSANGTYSDVTNLRLVNGGTTQTQSVTELGTYTSANGSLTFNDQTDGITYQGSVSGSVLTEIVNGLTQVYQKQ